MEIEDLPYNQSNVLISKETVTFLLTRYGIDTPINDYGLFCNAFVHKSYWTRKNENFVNGNVLCPLSCLPLQEESNERLEFLGDAVLNLATARYLFERYPEENEGFLTKMRSKLVNGTMLADLAMKLEFNKNVLISKQIEDGNGRTNKRILEDCFEAFLGAILLNFGFDETYEWIINMFEDIVDFADLLATNTNYKDQILKYFQYTFNYVPKFLEMNSDNSNGSKIYRVCLQNKEGETIAIGIGPNKKVAENDCAFKALHYYGRGWLGQRPRAERVSCYAASLPLAPSTWFL